MLSKIFRFHGIGSLGPVYRRGKTVRGQFIAIKYLRPNNRSSFRAAVVVSKKVHKSAVKRNRIRRRIYEALRVFEPQLPSDADIVLTVFDKRLSEIPSPQLVSIIASTLKKGGLLTGE